MSYDRLILTYLRAGMGVTPAFAYRRTGCIALHSAISRLREAGHDILCTMKYRGRKKWGRYTLRSRHG